MIGVRGERPSLPSFGLAVKLTGCTTTGGGADELVFEEVVVEVVEGVLDEAADRVLEGADLLEDAVVSGVGAVIPLTGGTVTGGTVTEGPDVTDRVAADPEVTAGLPVLVSDDAVGPPGEEEPAWGLLVHAVSRAAARPAATTSLMGDPRIRGPSCSGDCWETYQFVRGATGPRSATAPVRLGVTFAD
ncbi:MAG: hypothetical protein ACR2M5_01750 [Nakamurella sp.]